MNISRKKSIVWLLCVVFLMAGSAADVIAAERKSAMQADQRYVFAHYMTCYFGSTQFYKQEIELAQRHGIDGFAMNCGAWLNDMKYVKATERMYQAARELDTDFKLFISADWSAQTAKNVKDMIKRFYEHPNQMRHNAAPVLSTYGGSAGRYKKIIADLNKDGFKVCFVPNLSQQRFSANRSLESSLRLIKPEHVSGMFWFAADATVAEALRTNASLRRATLLADKIYMAGVAPSYNSPNLRQHLGIEGYGDVWEGIIRDGADWVEIVTWNDYNEDSNLMPWRWQRGWEKQYIDHDETYLDATEYYAKWHKSGRQPQITQDKVYYAYRNRSLWLRRAWDWKNEKWVDLTMTDWPFDQIHDDATDELFVTSFLTDPATLTVEIAGKKHTCEMPAGAGHARVPLKAGLPRFSLSRNGKQLLDFAGRKRIINRETQTKLNSPKGYHLLNRTWTGAGAVGKVVRRLQVEKGKLSEGAKTVKVNGNKGVQNEENHGSGFRIPVKGLETCTYNVRVRYSNPGDAEARLTLMAGGPPRQENAYPYFIPLFMPRTEDGEFKTISFFWSLYENTTWMGVEWMENDAHGRHRGNPLQNDMGRPIIDSIELVKVEPTEMPEPQDSIFPKMVRIPGGSFQMGDAGGRPDEKPEHKVTVSPFAMSKYEITNELYEKYNPKHARHRDGYSWRDREPVIYVSWVDGAKYCNWLSKQASLPPAYRQEGEKKQWVVDMNADGFRMPTEAEWEYVASGRGEERQYPWGPEAPRPGHHGRFVGEDALDTDVRLPAQYEAGTMVVGSYPAGASRDGVMDLTGNVCEWCSNWLQPYTKDSAKDPCGDKPGNYRAIRGSSWGYYGYPAEVHDREYNNPKYPGYVYIGLRVVLPQKGWNKMKKTLKDRR
ncbi:MAG: endo-1,3-alpha-glucanase family glycosylhydrolase [Candidatus Brocadiia bacterium]